MDAAAAALIGAAIGAVTSLSATMIQTWQSRRLRQDEANQARAAQLLDRRIVAHQAFFSALTTRTAQLGMTGGQEPHESSDALRPAQEAWDAIMILSSPEVGSRATAAMYAVADVVNASHVVDELRLGKANAAIMHYRDALQLELGVGAKSGQY